MCQIMEDFWEKGVSKGKKVGALENSKKIAIKMAQRGDSAEKIADVLEYDLQTIEKWIGESKKAN